jgi:hypothetical protein
MPVDAARIRDATLRQVAGIAGIFGGLILLVVAFAQRTGVIGGTPAALVGLGLVALCEMGLLGQLSRARPLVAFLLSIALLVAGLVAVLGLWSLLTAGSVFGVGLAGVGIATWFILAPLLALACAQVRLLDLAPAIAFALLTLLAVVASETKEPSVVLAAWAPYLLSWSWLGYAIFRSRDGAAGIPSGREAS